MNKDDYLNKKIILDSVFRESEFERTEKILLVGKNGKKEGPFIRKIFKENKGLGEIYKVLHNERYLGLNCDGIPNVYYSAKEGDKLIIVEECFIGISLTDFLKKNNFDINLFNSIYLQICEAVDYLHTGFSKPIIHRGINPENILVNEETHKIQLIDFGISQHFDEDEEQSALKFSSRRAFKADVRNDIYSLGKVLEFMMDGKNWANGNAEFPNDIYKQIVLKAIDSVPANRYNSVNSLIIEFQSAVKGRTWINTISDNKRIITLGHIWNILITLVFVFLVVATIYIAAQSASKVIVGMSLAEIIIYCIMTIGFILYPIYFILLFKPSLRKIFKTLPRLKFIHYFSFVIASCAAAMVLALIAQIFAV